MDIERTIKSLKARHFSVQHFASGDEACKYLLGEIKDTTVGIGGSKTVDQLGLLTSSRITETRYSGTGALPDLTRFTRKTRQRCSSPAQTP